MTVEIPSKVRSILYVLMVFVNAAFATLATAGVELSIWVLAVVAGFNAVVALIAKANVTPDGPQG